MSVARILDSPILVAVGSVEASADPRFTRVLSLGAPPLRAAPAHTVLELEDALSADLLAVVDACVDSLYASTRGERVLFHCLAGQSRSVAACAAALAVLTGVRVRDALALVTGRSTGASPNPSFAAQLQLLDALLHGEPSTLRGFEGGAAPAVSRALRAWWAAQGASPVASARAPGALAWLEGAAWEGAAGTPARPHPLDLDALQRDAEAAMDTALGADRPPPVRIGSLLEPPTAAACSALPRYCCGRCNAVLFSDANVVAHHGAPLAGAGSARGNCAPCSLVLVEPPDFAGWTPYGGAAVVLAPPASASARASARFSGLPRLVPETGTPGPSSSASGRLACAACGAKAGGWDWSGGGVCACGRLVAAPAVFVVWSRIVVRRG